jgi:hypothetical protein
VRRAKSTTVESASSVSCASRYVGETSGESCKTFDEHEPISASLDVRDPPSDQPEDLSSLASSSQVAEVPMPTPDSCPNCSSLKKENRKLSNSITTLREASKKRRAEIRKLRKKGFFPLFHFQSHKHKLDRILKNISDNQ